MHLKKQVIIARRAAPTEQAGQAHAGMSLQHRQGLQLGRGVGLSAASHAQGLTCCLAAPLLPACSAAADTIEASGLPRSRGPVVQKSGLGDRLARKGYSFEIAVSRGA